MLRHCSQIHYQYRFAVVFFNVVQRFDVSCCRFLRRLDDFNNENVSGSAFAVYTLLSSGSQHFSNRGPVNALQFYCGPPRVSSKIVNERGRGGLGRWECLWIVSPSI